MTTLVLRALGMGDLCVAVPALRALRRARPDEHVVLATPAVLAPLASRTGAVDEVLDCASPADLARAWGACGSPSWAVNLHGDGAGSRRALGAVGPYHYIGERRMRRPDRCHERERWCRLLRSVDPAGAPADDLRLGDRCPAPRAPVIVHPGAAFGAKRWPAPRYGAVAAALESASHPVVVTGGPGEREHTGDVVRAAGLDPTRNRAGLLDLEGLIGLVRSAAVVVSGDTGIAHVAAAFGVPSVTLFGPVPAWRWGPPAGPHRALSADADRRGDPFAAAPDPALLGVGVDEVLAAVACVVAAQPPPSTS